MKFRAQVFGALIGALSFNAMAAIEVVDPYARATPPNAPNSAAFMTLVNTSDKAIALVEASSPAAGKVELHTHVKKDGMMKMRQVKEIAIEEQSETILKPGGLHVMLFDLDKPLNPGESIALTLVFSDGSKITQNVPIRVIMGGAKMKHSNGSGQ